MNEQKNGGPAFPVEVDPTQPDGRQTGNTVFQTYGMSLRDYFIAHAPAEPQPWFEPVMPPEPTFPLPLKNMTSRERDEKEGWGDFIATNDLTEPRVKADVEAPDKAMKLRQTWRAEYVKQRYLQWPIAWADAMLEARK